MAGTGRRVVLAVLAAALVAVVCWVLLAPRFAIPDETGRAVDVAPVVVTPVPTTSPTGPTIPAVPTPAPAPSPAESGGPAVVPGPEPVEVGDDNGGDRDDDTGGGSGRDHPEDD
jgi:hypothetical protein